MKKKQLKERMVDTKAEVFLIKDTSTNEFVYQYATNDGLIKNAIFHEYNSAMDVADALQRSTGSFYIAERLQSERKLNTNKYAWLKEGVTYWYLERRVGYWKIFRNDLDDRINIEKGNVYKSKKEVYDANKAKIKE